MGSEGGPPLPERALRNDQAIRCIAPDGTESHIRPVKLHGCDDTVWLEWMDRYDHPREIPLHDGVYNRVTEYDSSVVPVERTRFGRVRPEL